jgi:2-polyprenyl-3-methyl-5-hydroxy-6-metoxy-1,4-benzoquinol methylase
MNIICPSCGNEIREDHFKRKYLYKTLSKEYKLYHCDKCDLEFWTPLEFVKEIYENEEEVFYEVSHQGVIELTDDHLMFLRSYEGKADGLKLLDIGCGNGSFIYKAKELGFDVYGIDIDSKSIQVASEKLGLKNVYNMSLDEFVEYVKKEGLKFDVITFFQVLEHQTDPSGFIQKVKELLNPGGKVIGSVPNRNRLFVEFSRSGRTYDFPPHHFLWFNKKALENIFLINSFRVRVSKLKPSFKSFTGFKRIIKLIFVLLYDRTKLGIFKLDVSEKGFLKSVIQNLLILIFSPIALILFGIYTSGLFESSSLYFEASSE